MTTTEIKALFFNGIRTTIAALVAFIGAICILELIFPTPTLSNTKLDNGTKVILKNGSLATIISSITPLTKMDTQNTLFYVTNDSYFDLSQGYGLWKSKYEYVKYSDIYAVNTGTTTNPSVR